MNMEKSGLPRNWVVLPAIDPELKRYVLLGYLQRVNARFAERKLYPYLEDLREHVEELKRLRRSKEELSRSMPGQLIGFDPRTGEAIHERMEEHGALSLIDEVLDFSIPGMNKVLASGRELREELSERILFAPVGIQPLHVTEGWLLLRMGKTARAYSYTMPLFREPIEEQQYRSVQTRYVTTFSVGIGSTYEHIKSQLRNSHGAMPNPATFVFETDLSLPHIETFMPLAKQMVYDHLASGNA